MKIDLHMKVTQQKAMRSVKTSLLQDHLQPRRHLKARSLSDNCRMIFGKEIEINRTICIENAFLIINLVTLLKGMFQH